MGVMELLDVLDPGNLGQLQQQAQAAEQAEKDETVKGKLKELADLRTQIRRIDERTSENNPKSVLRKFADLDALRQSLKGQDRTQEVAALQKVAEGVPGIREAVEALADKLPGIKASVAEVAGKLPKPGVIAGLELALKDVEGQLPALKARIAEIGVAVGDLAGLAGDHQATVKSLETARVYLATLEARLDIVEAEPKPEWPKPAPELPGEFTMDVERDRGQRIERLVLPNAELVVHRGRGQRITSVTVRRDT